MGEMDMVKGKCSKISQFLVSDSSEMPIFDLVLLRRAGMHLRVFGLAQLRKGAKTAHFGFACTAWVGCPEPQRGTTRAVAHRGPCAQLRTKVKHQLRAQLRAPEVDKTHKLVQRGWALE